MCLIMYLLSEPPKWWLCETVSFQIKKATNTSKEYKQIYRERECFVFIFYRKRMDVSCAAFIFHVMLITLRLFYVHKITIFSIRHLKVLNKFLFPKWLTQLGNMKQLIVKHVAVLLIFGYVSFQWMFTFSGICLSKKLWIYS